MSKRGPASVGDHVLLDDGLYRVDHGFVCAGFVVKDSRIVAIAPILKKRLFDYWLPFHTRRVSA